MNKTKKIGVILGNLGTPDKPTPLAIARYLWQFLTDERVVDLPRCWWRPLLACVILPLRATRIARNYRSIWMPEGSPLLAITKKQQQALADYLTAQGLDVQVEIGMTYGHPSMESAVENLLKKGVEKVIVLPLYPQYSSSTTAALFDALYKTLKTKRNLVPLALIHAYHCDESYINALVKSVQKNWQEDEYLLFSYHGIPLRYEQMGDYYREHCKQTTIAVVDRLGLRETQWGMVFQSRFGREEWLRPYADEFLSKAAARGIDKIAVICPGFAADCLETIEEVEQENKALFFASGGRSYRYIPALNAQADHIAMMAKLVLSKL